MDTRWEAIDTRNDRIIKYICVLAGGLKSNGSVHDFVRQRLDVAVCLYTKSNDAKIICMGGGTYHKPPLTNNAGFVIHESTACALYVHNSGVDKQDILREWASYDTIANGFYAFLNYIIPLNIKHIAIVTSKFHMKRSTVIFKYFQTIFKLDIQFDFHTSSNLNMSMDQLEIRNKREEESLQQFIKLTQNIKTVAQFTQWFYTEHNAYKAILEYNSSVSDTIKTTY